MVNIQSFVEFSVEHLLVLAFELHLSKVAVLRNHKYDQVFFPGFTYDLDPCEPIKSKNKEQRNILYAL